MSNGMPPAAPEVRAACSAQFAKGGDSLLISMPASVLMEGVNNPCSHSLTLHIAASDSCLV